TRSERQADALQRLDQEESVWIATGNDQGLPHLIPVSLAWDGASILVATPTHSPSVRNALVTGRARAALESTADVVIIDADAEVVDVSTVSPDLLKMYVDRVGWNPNDQPGDWSLLVLTPRVVLSWNSVAEIEGRVIMRGGIWGK
ncbi:MAG: hypothetical protein GY926_09245, partial [bacterium]|nr:hypothetical protein [bacterium]